ncbi:unnamed protein product [Schistocephalus solidus]|uniref:Uncharacterized protein n=1 Tax=Schistocephalus solidus TaxID=70667 RepID=A0A183SLJ9_SCHSO|nr:unnamed protein product [Schistocephalus solidus]
MQTSRIISGVLLFFQILLPSTSTPILDLLPNASSPFGTNERLLLRAVPEIGRFRVVLEPPARALNSTLEQPPKTNSSGSESSHVLCGRYNASRLPDHLNTVTCSCFLDNGFPNVAVEGLTLAISRMSYATPSVLFIPLVLSGVCDCPRDKTACQHLFTNPSVGVCFDERLIRQPECAEDIPFDAASSKRVTAIFLAVVLIVLGLFMIVLTTSCLWPRHNLLETLNTKNVSEATEHIVAGLGVGIAHRPKATMRIKVMRIKERLKPNEQSGIVYRIPCQNCSCNYTGQTGRMLGSRIHEHKLAVRWSDGLSKVAAHTYETGHEFNFTAAMIIAHATCKTSRELIEALASDENSVNRIIDLAPAYRALRSHLLTGATALVYPKERVSYLDKNGVVCKTPFSSCNAVHSGKTGKSVSTRLHEHHLAVRRRDHLSQVAMHALETGHKFAWEKTRIVGTCPTRKGREFLEAIHSDEACINWHIGFDAAYKIGKHKFKCAEPIMTG